MPELSQIPTAVMMLVFTGLIFGAGLLALSEFRTGMVTNTAGCNATVKTDCGDQYHATGNVTGGIGNFAEQFPTIGTILGVSALIIVVVSAFSFGSRFTGGAVGR